LEAIPIDLTKGNIVERQIIVSFLAIILLPIGAVQADESSLNSLISQHAKANDISESLVHRVVRRESNYNPRAIGKGGALGLMQIKYATARGMGYAGPPSGLLDANTNLTYAVRYLAGAYRLANGHPDRALAYFTSGYYDAAKSRGMTMAAAQQSPGSANFAPVEVETTSSIAEGAANPSEHAELVQALIDQR
jgi:soluble lytic murein transglycosylase-like protein